MTRCTFGNLEHLTIYYSLILIIVRIGMSVREISAEEIILLVGNFVADSVINVEGSDMNSSMGVVNNRSFVPV